MVVKAFRLSPLYGGARKPEGANVKKNKPSCKLAVNTAHKTWVIPI